MILSLGTILFHQAQDLKVIQDFKHVGSLGAFPSEKNLKNSQVLGGSKVTGNAWDILISQCRWNMEHWSWSTGMLGKKWICWKDSTPEVEQQKPLKLNQPLSSNDHFSFGAFAVKVRGSVSLRKFLHPKMGMVKIQVMNHRPRLNWDRFNNELRVVSILYVPGSKLLIVGMVIPPLIGNPFIGCINSY